MATCYNSPMGVFNFCWHALLDESRKFNNALFSLKHLSISECKLNCDKLEERLAYLYKCGYVKILLSEKCALTFFEQFSTEETVYLTGDLQICSLSPGPGLDIVGFLMALYKSSKYLNSVPSLKAINYYGSWKGIFEVITSSILHGYSRKHSVRDTVTFPADKIQFLQSDIFSTLSTDAQDYISCCDILLMFYAFYSKPGCELDTLEKIFPLLKPGSLILLSASRKILQTIHRSGSIYKFANCIFGAKSIKLKNLPVNEDIVKAVGIKPNQSAKGHFVVLQKKFVPEIVDSSLKGVLLLCAQKTVSHATKNSILWIGKDRKRRRGKSILERAKKSFILGDLKEENNDTNSEKSFASSSKQSDISIDSKNIIDEGLNHSEISSGEKSVLFTDTSSECELLLLNKAFPTVNYITLESMSINDVPQCNVQELLFKSLTENIPDSENYILLKEN